MELLQGFMSEFNCRAVQGVLIAGNSMLHQTDFQAGLKQV